MTLLVILAGAWAIITVTITLKYVLNTIWRIRYASSRWILSALCMSPSSCHHPSLFILYFLCLFSVLLSCGFTVPLHSRSEYTRLIVLVERHDCVLWILVVAWTRVVSSLLTLYRNYFLRFVSWHHPFSWTFSSQSSFNFVISRAYSVFLISRKHFLSILLPN